MSGAYENPWRYAMWETCLAPHSRHVTQPQARALTEAEDALAAAEADIDDSLP
jgi:hypothetical protein